VSEAKSGEISFTINKSQCGQRLDIFLAQSDAAISRSHVKCVIEEGDMLVNGKKPKVSQKLKEGDVVVLTQRPPQEATAVAQDMPSILFMKTRLLLSSINRRHGCASGAGQP